MFCVYNRIVMGAERDRQAGPMQSQVNWALLGLVIERPSYAYELARRFERTYEGVLTLSSVSHVYTALAALRERTLIEELPGTRVGRQPKPHYKATAKGHAGYAEWLVGQGDEDFCPQRLLVPPLYTFSRDPHAALRMLPRYEQACLTEAGRSPAAPRGEAAVGETRDSA